MRYTFCTGLSNEELLSLVLTLMLILMLILMLMLMDICCYTAKQARVASLLLCIGEQVLH
jgi:hypothetical protein